MEEVLLKVSYNDTKKGNKAFYHGLILGMNIYLEKDYIIKSNIESGLGRADVIIEPKDKKKRGFIFEFKIANSKEDLEKLSKEALKRIEEKKYIVSLKEAGLTEVTCIGIAFHDKELKIEYK